MNPTPTLLTRDSFRNSVFERDGFKCVICREAGKDAHHILERRLFGNGGYYLDNGATLCERHHIEAEQTTLTCDEIRHKTGIRTIVLPEHFYRDLSYDKWGNIILSTGQRIKGELFYDASVQKILTQGGVMDLFQRHVKYPRTYHVHWSNMLKDDRMLPDDKFFVGKRVIATVKMDGENTTMYRDYIHARSLDWAPHETRKWVKGLWSQIAYLLDENMRICGENLFAVHSVKYSDLKSYFMMFSMWSDHKCLTWEETVEYSKILGLEMVPVFFDGIYDRETIIKKFEDLGKHHEGYVIRLADEFTYMDFRKSVAKYVRPEFRQALNNSHGHWVSKKIETNKLA